MKVSDAADQAAEAGVGESAAKRPKWSSRELPTGSEAGDAHRAEGVSRKKCIRDSLPIDGVRSQVVNSIRSNPVCIIVGETGSGKSTQIPKMCYEEGISGQGMVAISQPRRVAAITLAKRVAFEMGTGLGETVGYKVRFEDVEYPDTKLLYATDGVLLREAIHDSILARYSMVFVDEAHERSLHTDVLLYVLRLCFEQRIRTDNPLKLVIMSATLDAQLFSDYFNSAPIFWVEGRNHPIDLYYLNSVDSSDDNYVFNALTTVMQIHQEEPPSAGVLVFLTGQEEIEVACKKATEASQLLNLDICALPLYAGLSPYAQMKVFEPVENPKARKVVFSTNISETSVTIPGIRIVVDSGKVKTKTFLADRRIDVLRVEDISRASGTQRAGRAGREAPGKCYRLYAEKHFQSLPATTVPEILRANLTTALLELYRMGMTRVQKLSLISSPSPESIDAALVQLRLLEALQPADKKERVFLSEMGNRLAAFPIDPPLARVLVAAAHNDCLEEALTAVSFMSTDSVFLTSSSDRENCNAARRKFEVAEGDHCTLLNVYKGYRLAKKERKVKEWCSANFVHERVLATVFKIRRQLRRICSKETMSLRSCGTDLIKLRKSLCAGLFMRACEYDKSQNSYRMFTSSNASVKIHPSSCLAGSRPTAFVFSDLVRTNELYARDITVVDVEWIKEILESKKHILKEL